MLDYCKTCFHVEFCVQDAKQFTELTDCQSRDLDKLYFHFNTTLTSGNLAKTEAFEKGVVFSMATVKVLFHNIFDPSSKVIGRRDQILLLYNNVK